MTNENIAYRRRFPIGERRKKKKIEKKKKKGGRKKWPR